MEGYVNASVPFSWQEHNYLWKSDRRYHDFHPGNEHNASCEYPRMWGQDGYPIGEDITSQMKGCKSSEYDQVSETMKQTGPMFQLTRYSTGISKEPAHIPPGNPSFQLLLRFKID